MSSFHIFLNSDASPHQHIELPAIGAHTERERERANEASADEFKSSSSPLVRLSITIPSPSNARSLKLPLIAPSAHEDEPPSPYSSVNSANPANSAHSACLRVPILAASASPSSPLALPPAEAAAAEAAQSPTGNVRSGASLCTLLLGLLLLIAPILISIGMMFSLLILTFQFSCSVPAAPPAAKDPNSAPYEPSVPLFCCFHPIIHYFYIYAIILTAIIIICIVFGVFKSSLFVNALLARPADSEESRQSTTVMRIRQRLKALSLVWLRNILRAFSAVHVLFSVSIMVWAFVTIHAILQNQVPTMTAATGHGFVADDVDTNGAGDTLGTPYYPPYYPYAPHYTVENFCSIKPLQIVFFAFSDFLILLVGGFFMKRIFDFRILWLERFVNFFDRIEIINTNWEFDAPVEELEYDSAGNIVTVVNNPNGVEKKAIEGMKQYWLGCSKARSYLQNASGPQTPVADIENGRAAEDANASSRSRLIVDTREPSEGCKECDKYKERIMFITAGSSYPGSSPRDAASSSLSPPRSPAGGSSPSSSADVCSVCLEAFRSHAFVKEMPRCLHVFHVACLDRWLIHHNSCPLCRSKAVGPEDPVEAGAS